MHSLAIMTVHQFNEAGRPISSVSAVEASFGRTVTLSDRFNQPTVYEGEIARKLTEIHATVPNGHMSIVHIKGDKVTLAETRDVAATVRAIHRAAHKAA